MGLSDSRKPQLLRYMLCTNLHVAIAGYGWTPLKLVGEVFTGNTSEVKYKYFIVTCGIISKVKAYKRQNKVHLYLKEI